MTTTQEEQKTGRNRACADLWPAAKLERAFQQAAPQIESVARTLSPHLADVNMAFDIESCLPVIRFVFTGKSTHDIECIPKSICGYRAVATYK